MYTKKHDQSIENECEEFISFHFIKATRFSMILGKVVGKTVYFIGLGRRRL